MAIPPHAPFVESFNPTENVLSTHLYAGLSGEVNGDQTYWRNDLQQMAAVSWKENTPFTAILQLTGPVSQELKWKLVDVKTGTHYSIAFAEFEEMINQSQINRGYVNGLWQVIKGRSGYTLKLLETVPWDEEA